MHHTKFCTCRPYAKSRLRIDPQRDDIQLFSNTFSLFLKFFESFRDPLEEIDYRALLKPHHLLAQLQMGHYKKLKPDQSA